MTVELDIENITEGRLDEKQEPPKKYVVIALNDNTTPHEFVMDTLCSHFNLSQKQAQVVMRHAEKKGRAVVRIYPKDVAESKVLLANNFSRATRNVAFNIPMELTFICEPE